VNAAREAWSEAQLDLDPTRIVFIDETAANTKMARLYGRVPRGERCRAPVPHGHWKTTTFTAGLRYDGSAAPMVLDSPMNGEAFLAYVEQALVPELRPRDIVIMDMCGRPRWCKKNLFEERAWSSADMCPASAAACHMPPARMGVRGAGPIQSRALKARIHDLVFPIPSR
jgi:DDE superfamily endonuclease